MPGSLWLLASALLYASSAIAQDPCASIAGQNWVSPSALRACYQSLEVIEDEKANILEVMNKTVAFHTSVNYQIQAPEPFSDDVHENLYTDMARISAQSYASYYDLHIDLSRMFKRLNDGHCVWVDDCFDSAFLNFLPTPLTLITEEDGDQNVHIAYEAFQVASAEFADEIDFWQDALNGTLESLSGATVFSINGNDPWDAINANALITGSFQAFGTRQNSFFASYQRATTGWNYIMGNFAQQALPLADDVVLEIQKVNSTQTETITIPYRARIGTTTLNFTDGASYRANNCKAIPGTNGVNVYANNSADGTVIDPTAKKQQAPAQPQRQHKELLNVQLDSTPLSDVLLPPTLTPPNATNSSYSVAQFYMLNDSVTGAMALGSFSDADYNRFLGAMLDGLVELKSLGATQLVVDVSNNGGGFICAAHWLHRIIAGPKETTVPQAGLDTKARAGPLAQQITDEIVKNDKDPDLMLLYNPLNWRNASEVTFPADKNWLQPTVNLTINGHPDAFSPRLGQECQPEGFPVAPPDTALFDPSKVVIVSNGRCASSCSLFSITMKKEEGAKMAVIGGKADVQQNYCGTVGGQSTDFSTIDTEIKSVGLKNSSLAPPDLLVHGVQGITWRLGFGIVDTEDPEEWQTHDADLNIKITPELANNPVAIWESVVAELL